MSSRYVQLPNGSYLEWPEGVSAATFKAKATKIMGSGPELPATTRRASMPLPTPLGPKPFIDRLMDYIGESMESSSRLPEQLKTRIQERYKEGEKKGGFSGGMRMAESPILAEGDILQGMLKSVLGVTTPGIIYRMSKKEDPAKIVSDSATFLGGYMAGGPKETGSAEISIGDAARQITDAVNPIPKQMASFQRLVGQHLDKIVTFAKANGIDVGSIDGLAQAMKGSGDWIKNHYYNDILGPVKNRPVSIAGSVKGYSGETAGTPSAATLGQLDARLSQINAELNPKYAKGGIAAQSAVKSATELNAEAATIRKVLYGELANATGLTPEVVANTRGAFGALDDLAEKTTLAAAKERNIANRAARAPLTVNPFSGSSGKQFIADKAISKMRGDVVGKQLRESIAKAKVPKYELPIAKPTMITPKSRVPLRGESSPYVPPRGSTQAEREAVSGKLSTRRLVNETARRKSETDAANAGLERTIRSARHPFWQGDQP